MGDKQLAELKNAATLQSEDSQCYEPKKEEPAQYVAAFVPLPAFLNKEIKRAARLLDNGGVLVGARKWNALLWLPGSVGLDDGSDSLGFKVDLRADTLSYKLRGFRHERVEVAFMRAIVAKQGNLSPIHARFGLVGEGNAGENGV